MPRLDVRTIRRRMEAGQTVTEIAKDYGVSRQAIYKRLKKDEEKRRGRAAARETLNKVKDFSDEGHMIVDPETGMVINNRGLTSTIIGRMGDERVTKFVQYHMEMLAMRQGVNKKDVEDLYQRFINYLSYCAEHGVVPNNQNAYFAIGVSRQEMSAWRLGNAGTQKHKEFAEMVTSFFASVHEQGSTDGVLNPISAMFWQKAHDGLIEASKVEVIQENPLGEKRSAEEITAKYADILPEE